MTIRIENAQETPCWVLVHGNGDTYEHFEGAPHYPDRAAALRYAAEHDGAPGTARRLAEPCLVGVCRECGRELEADYGVHYETRLEAEQAVAEGCPDCT